tara:strand:- start:41020 stop:41430 length:411 start_codon:yes stop_codon:yes gene_type:complete
MARLVPKIYPNDVDENTPIGLSFPLTVGTQKQNFITTHQVHDNLRNLILTMKGERPMQPTFGSDLYYLLFEPISDTDLAEAAMTAIKDAVAEWMPVVQILDVTVTSNRDENKILIIVTYAVGGWQTGNILNLTVKV